MTHVPGVNRRWLGVQTNFFPAMAITGAVFIAVRVVIVAVVRPHYLSPISKLVSDTHGQDILSLVPRGSLVLITYQPATRFWAFQGIETGIYLVTTWPTSSMHLRQVLEQVLDATGGVERLHAAIWDSRRMARTSLS